LLKTDHTLQDTIAANREVSSNQLTAFDREAKIRLRSYIAIIPGRVLFEPNKRLQTKITAIATGQTPAYEVKGMATTTIAPYPLPEGFDLATLETKPAAGNQGLISRGKGLSILMETEEPLTQEQVERVTKLKTHRIYIWGRIEFSDVFHCRHWTTTFCNVINEDAPGGPAYDLCQSHNEADDAAVCIPER
jgi:hypothetical protein